GADAGAEAQRTRALTAVEGEQLRVEGREADAATTAEQALGVEALRLVPPHDDGAAAEAQRAGDRVVEAGGVGIEGADHELDVVLAIAVEKRQAGQWTHAAVDAGFPELELAGRGENLLVVALAAADDRGEEGDPLAPH